jgi:hypothetical protein
MTGITGIGITATTMTGITGTGITATTMTGITGIGITAITITAIAPTTIAPTTGAMTTTIGGATEPFVIGGGRVAAICTSYFEAQDLAYLK